MRQSNDSSTEILTLSSVGIGLLERSLDLSNFRPLSPLTLSSRLLSISLSLPPSLSFTLPLSLSPPLSLSFSLSLSMSLPLSGVLEKKGDGFIRSKEEEVSDVCALSEGVSISDATVTTPSITLSLVACTNFTDMPNRRLLFAFLSMDPGPVPIPIPRPDPGLEPVTVLRVTSIGLSL